MQPWHVTLFGGLRVEQGAQEITRFRTQKVGALLAYLALFQSRTHAREELADLLWPDAAPEVARANLRTALSSLRRQLEPPGVVSGSVLVAEGRLHVRLAPDAVLTDVARFEAAIRSAARSEISADERALRLADAVAAYAGPLLPGLYETWVLTERDRLAEACLGALGALVAHYEQSGDLPTSLDFARRAVSADPLREEAHADIIRLLVALGEPAAAQRQLRELERILRDELDAEPSPEVYALLTQSLRPSPAEARPSKRSSPAAASFAISPSRAVRSAAPDPERPGAPAPLHLPLTLTRFFGRDEEMTRLRALLLSPHTRLLTLTGPGGSGKTRFAIEAARTLGEHFTGGVWFVPLADVREASRLPAAIADALALPRSPTAAPLEQVAAALEHPDDLPALLVLDNLEHLTEAGADLVQTLLGYVPRLSCLVTSRHLLLIDGEQEFRIAPLPTPPLLDSPERLIQFSSVQLFVNRAQAARSDFQLSSRNAPAVAELVTRLEGIPLALELAAAWSQTLTPARMLERLDHRFDLLVTRRRNAPDRHATLRAAVEWSYQLLPASVQRFFGLLSVFRGGWTLEAAEAVTGEPLALEYLTELSERSLVVTVAEESGQTEEVMRFRMLETLREFAEEQVGAGAAEQEALAVRHRAYFLGLAEETEPHLSGPEQAHWLRRLESEHDNFRVVLEYTTVSPERAEEALRLTAALWWFWTRRGHFREGRRWIEAALQNAGGAPIETTAARTYVRVLQGASAITYFLSDGSAALAFAEESLTRARALGTPAEIAFSLFLVALNRSALATPEAMARAEALSEESLVWAETAGAPALIARALVTLSISQFSGGAVERGVASMERCIALFREVGDTWELVIALVNQGTIRRLLRDNRARECFREAAMLAHAQGNPQGMAWSLWGLMSAAAGESQLERAARLLGAAERLSESLSIILPPVWESEVYGPDAAAVRAALGETAFAAARTRGRALSLDEAIAYALEEPPAAKQ